MFLSNIFDFYKKNSKKGTISTKIGLIFTTFFIILIILLVYNQINNFLNPRVISEVHINHAKDDSTIIIDLLIDFPKYPCAILSLDKIDILQNHTVDVKENLKKYIIEEHNYGIYETYSVVKEYFYSDTNYDSETIIKNAQESIKKKYGCRIEGQFKVKSVGGQFHISFHKYIEEFRFLLENGFLPDFSYIISYMKFDKINENHRSEVINQFHNGQSQNLYFFRSYKNVLKTYGFPFHSKHLIKLIPSRYHLNSGKEIELLQYSHNDLIIQDNSPIIEFDLKIENMILEYKKENISFLIFLLKTISLISGLYMIIELLKNLFEESVIKLIYKEQIGKLE